MVPEDITQEYAGGRTDQTGRSRYGTADERSREKGRAAGRGCGAAPGREDAKKAAQAKIGREAKDAAAREETEARIERQLAAAQVKNGDAVGWSHALSEDLPGHLEPYSAPPYEAPPPPISELEQLHQMGDAKYGHVQRGRVRPQQLFSKGRETMGSSTPAYPASASRLPASGLPAIGARGSASTSEFGGAEAALLGGSGGSGGGSSRGCTPPVELTPEETDSRRFEEHDRIAAQRMAQYERAAAERMADYENGGFGPPPRVSKKGRGSKPARPVETPIRDVATAPADWSPTEDLQAQQPRRQNRSQPPQPVGVDDDSFTSLPPRLSANEAEHIRQRLDVLERSPAAAAKGGCPRIASSSPARFHTGKN